MHTHLTLCVDGTARQVPARIGITPPRQVQQTPQGPIVTGGSCFYWLHAHAPDRISRIESPAQRSFTLGEFFAVWGQPVGPGQVGPATAKVTAFVNGRNYQGDPADVAPGDQV